jgi:hypothetical protein
LLQKPLNGGIPERDATAMRKAANVSFILFLMPPMSLMYFESAA